MGMINPNALFFKTIYNPKEWWVPTDSDIKVERHARSHVLYEPDHQQLIPTDWPQETPAQHHHILPDPLVMNLLRLIPIVTPPHCGILSVIKTQRSMIERVQRSLKNSTIKRGKRSPYPNYPRVKTEASITEVGQTQVINLGLTTANPWKQRLMSIRKLVHIRKIR